MANNVAPGVYSTTIDQSFISTEYSATTVSALFPIFSQRGPDNIIKNYKAGSTALIKRVYGEPRFSKFGQTYHNALQWASQNCDISICRLLPPDATYANVLFIYKKTKTQMTELFEEFTYSALVPSNVIKVNSIDGIEKGMVLTIDDIDYTVESVNDTGTKSITMTENIGVTITIGTPVYFRKKEISTKSISDATTIEKLKEGMNFTGDIKADDVEVPFLLVYPLGRGEDYNKYSLTLTIDTDYEDTYKEFKVYDLKLYDKKEMTGVDFAVNDEEFQFSFFSDAANVNGTSLYISDVVNDYSTYLNIEYNEYIYKNIVCDMFGLDIDTASYIDIFNKDVLQGSFKFEDKNNARFSGGSDGSIWTKEGTINMGTDSEVTGTDQHGADKSQDLKYGRNLLRSFFNGEIDPLITNRKWVPVKYIFDANFNKEIKMAISSLVSGLRDDVRYICDTGFVASPQGELIFRDSFPIDNCNVAIYPNNGYVMDPYSTRKIKVTSTYNLCKLYAKVRTTYGYHYAIGGYNERGQLDEMTDLAYSPNLEFRNQFTKNQLNTIVADPKGVFVLENITTQKAASHLQQNHIADTLQVIRVETEDFCEKYVLDLRLTDQRLKEVEGEIYTNLSKWVDNGACEWIEVSVTASRRDKELQRAKANINLKFVGIAKIIELAFNVMGENASPSNAGA